MIRNGKQTAAERVLAFMLLARAEIDRCPALEGAEFEQMLVAIGGGLSMCVSQSIAALEKALKRPINV